MENILKMDNALIHLLNSLKDETYILNTQCQVHHNIMVL